MYPSPFVVESSIYALADWARAAANCLRTSKRACLVVCQSGLLDCVMRLFSSTHLLSQAHNLEALEVGELLALDGALAVLGPGAVVPGAVNTNLLPEGLESSVTGGAGKLLNDNGGQREVREGGGVAGYGNLGVGGRTLDKDLFHALSAWRSC